MRGGSVFSVVIPSRDHARFLPAAVVSALAASWVAEVLIADDASSDGSAELIAGLAHDARVRRIEAPGAGRHGAARRLDALVAEARSEWIAILDSDDAFVPGRFEVLAALCVREPVEFAAGALLVIDDDGRVLGPKRGPLDPEYPYPAGIDVARTLARHEMLDLLASQNLVATTSNMVFTRSLHARIGGFRAEYPLAHDWDFALRACAIGRARWVPQFLTLYRTHRHNTIGAERSSSAPEVQALFAALLSDFPALRKRDAFARCLAANRYLNDGREAS